MPPQLPHIFSHLHFLRGKNGRYCKSHWYGKLSNRANLVYPFIRTDLACRAVRIDDRRFDEWFIILQLITPPIVPLIYRASVHSESLCRAPLLHWNSMECGIRVIVLCATSTDSAHSTNGLELQQGGEAADAIWVVGSLLFIIRRVKYFTVFYRYFNCLSCLNYVFRFYRHIRLHSSLATGGCTVHDTFAPLCLNLSPASLIDDEIPK